MTNYSLFKNKQTYLVRNSQGKCVYRGSDLKHAQRLMHQMNSDILERQRKYYRDRNRLFEGPQLYLSF